MFLISERLRYAWRSELIDKGFSLEMAREIALEADVLAHVEGDRTVEAVEAPARAKELLRVGPDLSAGCSTA